MQAKNFVSANYASGGIGFREIDALSSRNVGNCGYCDEILDRQFSGSQKTHQQFRSFQAAVHGRKKWKMRGPSIEPALHHRLPECQVQDEESVYVSKN